MTAPALVSETSGSTTASAGTSHAITLPATVNAGNRLVAVICIQYNGTGNTFTWPAGWTELIDFADNAYDLGASVAWRIADGTEDGGTVTVTSSQSEKATHKSWCFSGAGTVYAAVGTPAYDAAPNPPNLAPGVGTADFHWISVGAVQGDQGLTGYSSGYTNTGYIRTTGSYPEDSSLGWGRKTSTASSENPGALATSGSNFNFGITIGLVAAVATIDSVTPTSPEPGEAVSIVISGFASAPNSANSTYAGIAQTLDTATTTLVTLTWPAFSTFAPGQSNDNTRWLANYTLTLGNGSESANYTVQTDSPTLTASSDFAARDSGTQYYPVTGADTGDDQYTYFTSGSGTSNAASSNLTPVGEAVGVVKTYDVSGGVWLAERTEMFIVETSDNLEHIVCNPVRKIVNPIVRAVA